jgi:uncharacterized protein YbaR (Trm112 family)
MVHPELLDILVCPETHQPVRLADAEVLARVNAAVAAGTLRTREGEEVRKPLEAALLREDGRLLYPVRDDIPVMLLDEAIPLDPPS